MAKEQVIYYGTGRRKSSVARVRLTPGTGIITINGDFNNFTRRCGSSIGIKGSHFMGLSARWII